MDKVSKIVDGVRVGEEIVESDMAPWAVEDVHDGPEQPMSGMLLQRVVQAVARARTVR